MSKNSFVIFLLIFLSFAFCFEASAKASFKKNRHPYAQNENFVIHAMIQIVGAEATFNATTGNYGTLNDLRQAEFIDEALASGDKYGYHFVVYKVDPTPTTPATYYVTAIPRLYLKSGRRSFFVNESGELRGADKNGAVATDVDPTIETCFDGNEGCTISDLRALTGAQATYLSSVGNGLNYGTLNQLYAAGLINRVFGSGLNHGYSFTCTITAPTNNTPASYRVSAVPTNYGVTGFRSFYTNESGVIYGANKHGAPADENDPPLRY